MGNFNGSGNRGGGFRGGNSGGGRSDSDRRDRPSFGGGRGGDSRGPVTMHKAVCDECHKSCEVPFRPSGDKPIYCSDCFSNKRGDDDRGSQRDFGGDRPAPRRDFDRPAPSFSKPVAGAGDDMKNYFREINVKLDRLTSAIEKLAQGKGDLSADKAGAKSFVKTPQFVAPKAEVKKLEVKKAPIAKVAPKKAIAVKALAKKVVAKKGKTK